MYKILFVCLGNICRSPAAENIMNQRLVEAGLEGRIHCDSAGTAGYHIGAPPDRRMAASLKQRGYSVSGRARQFEFADFQEFDLILAMDRENHRDILCLDRAGLYHSNVKLFCDYAQNHRDREVPDPYYGGPEGFERVITLLEDGCQSLLAELQAKLAAESPQLSSGPADWGPASGGG